MGQSSFSSEKRQSTDPRFQLAAKILYTDNTTEEYTADFSSSTDEWQPASVTFAKAAYKAINKIQIYCRYAFESGYALFDDIQLIPNSCETGLRAEDFFVDTSRPDPDEGEEEIPEETPGFEEVHDYYGNPITDTQFTDGEYGTIYRSMEYNADDPSTLANDAGNDLIAETDPRGYKTYYDVNPSNSRAVCITDRCGIGTEYGYDNAGRINSMFVFGEDSTLAELAYDYNAHGNIASIRRGDGQNYIEYTMDYDRFYKLSSIDITSYGNLVDLTYNNSGRLKTITYPRDGQVSYVYNRYGQVISETWTKNNVVTDKYRYVYGDNNRLLRCIDITRKIEYNYYYKDNSIYSIVENAIELDHNEIIVSRLPIQTVLYSRNINGELVNKIITNQTQKQQIYTYSLNDPSTITLPTSAVCHSKSDHLGRKTFDEIELGSGYLSRQFTYLAGKITPEHQAYDKVKSAPTTNLVDTITYADGRTIRYQYDPEERITKVTDSVEGVTAYTYDALGQLTSEKKNGITTAIVNDGAGNILSKGGKTYTYDSMYPDLLTSYNGESISYGTGINKSLNPIQYRGFAMTWTKGRQLASASGNGKTISFTYDPKGICTGKTVNGIKHEYLLEGTKLLRDGYTGALYLYDNEEQVCGMVYQNQAYYFYKNLQGDVIAITDAKGAVIAKYSYDAWGMCTITGLTSLGTTVANKNLFRYRSYIYDADLKLYYLQSRYYDPETGRFINGDEPIFLGANESIVSYHLFTYCENDPVSRSDADGYTSSKKATTLYVSDLNKPNAEMVQEIRMTFAPNFVNFRRYLVNNAKDFQYAWEDSKRSEIVVIDTHGCYESLSTSSGTTLFRTTMLKDAKFNLMARVVILLGCNTGHYDHRYDNIAHYIAQKLPFGIVVASDGLTKSILRKNQRMIHRSEVDGHWREQRKETYFFLLGMYRYGLRPINEGWLIYKSTWSEPYKTGLFEFTTCGLFAYLAKRKFYDGWAKFWKDQSNL